MFGFVGQYANFSTDALAESVKHLKKRGGQEVDRNDPTAYKLGADLWGHADVEGVTRSP